MLNYWWLLTFSSLKPKKNLTYHPRSKTCQHCISQCWWLLYQDVFHFRSMPLIFSPASPDHPTKWLLRALQQSRAIVTTLMKVDVYFGRKTCVFKSTWLEVMMYVMNQWLLCYVCYSVASGPSEMWCRINVDYTWWKVWFYVFLWWLCHKWHLQIVFPPWSSENKLIQSCNFH